MPSDGNIMKTVPNIFENRINQRRPISYELLRADQLKSDIL